VVHTPLMWLDKAETWRLAQTLGGDDLVTLIVEASHTCYHGDREHRHAWGHGCGNCPACELRAQGYHRFIDQAADKQRQRQTAVANDKLSSITSARA